MVLSENSWLVEDNASSMTSRMLISPACHLALPDSIFARSSTWLMRRVSRSDSRVMMPRNFARCGMSSAGIVVQYLGKRADRGQRRAQFMRHRRNEIVFQAVELLQPLVGRAQFGRRDFELARFLLELAAVSEHLRSFVQDVHDLVDAERLFLHDGRDHYARRAGADGACQQRFREMDQIGIGLELLGRFGAGLQRICRECVAARGAGRETVRAA